jgi:putative transposase
MIKMEMLYKVAGIKRQVYFSQQKIKEQQMGINLKILETVNEIRKNHNQMGARNLHHVLKIKTMGINKFEQLISESGLGIHHKRNWIKTTDSNHPYRKYTNLTNGIIIDNIDCLWATDITYWLNGDRVYYLIFIVDVYSRRILGYSACDNMEAINNLKVLEMAFELREKNYFLQLIHHSDKGSQYCATLYIDALKKANIAISMARNSLENPYAERLNGIIKNGYLEYFDTSNYSKLQKSLTKAVWLYNHEKPHSELNKMTPVEYEAMVKRQNSEERFNMELYDFNNNREGGILGIN